MQIPSGQVTWVSLCTLQPMPYEPVSLPRSIKTIARSSISLLLKLSNVQQP